jgi:hypothetical protein
MSQEKRLGWAALAMGLLGVAVMYLWPDKKWIGWTFLVAAALAFLAWIYLEIRPTHKLRMNHGCCSHNALFEGPQQPLM